MAKASTVSCSAYLSGDGVTETYAPAGFPLLNASAPGGVPSQVVLASGNNTVAVPAGTLTMIIIPPAGSVVAKVLKGVAGDTGFALNSAAPSVLSLPASTATILINAASSETVQIAWL